MVRLARLEDGMSVWEPGAGKGSIAEVIRETARVRLDVCELQAELRQILELKGFNVIGFNCFEVTGEYDRILMNPPFGKGLEISHITHAYNRLADGGRLVTIAPESVSFRKDRAYREFRDWLAD
jgi:16S rRNA G1207 methylase RsmC